MEDLADERTVIDTGLAGAGIGVGAGGEYELAVLEGDETDHPRGRFGGLGIELEELVRAALVEDDGIGLTLPTTDQIGQRDRLLGGWSGGRRDGRVDGGNRGDGR